MKAKIFAGKRKYCPSSIKDCETVYILVIICFQSFNGTFSLRWKPDKITSSVHKPRPS